MGKISRGGSANRSTSVYPQKKTLTPIFWLSYKFHHFFKNRGLLSSNRSFSILKQMVQEESLPGDVRFHLRFHY